MGLDMYLERMPRFENVTVKQIRVLESYLKWKEDRNKKDSKASTYSFEEWTRLNIYDLPNQEAVDFYRPFFTIKYDDWDTEHKYGFKRIMEEVGYWRKANQIHNWFVENVQDGEDDCCYHEEVTKEKLEELLDICKRVINKSNLIDGSVVNGYKYDNGKEEAIYEKGLIIEDPSVAIKLLPTSSGFFFGGTNYDEYYIKDVNDTIEIITKILETTDFDKEIIYYVSSW